MNKLTKAADNLEKPFLFIGILFMIFVITYQTFFRYFVSSSMEFLSSRTVLDFFGSALGFQVLMIYLFPGVNV